MLPARVRAARSTADSHESTWSSGVDGRGGSVAVVDSGVDGAAPRPAEPDVGERQGARPGRHLRRGRARLPGVPDRVHDRHDRRPRHARRRHGRRRRHARRRASTAVSRRGRSSSGSRSARVRRVLYALGAFEWILANHAKHGIVAVNNSWGPVSDHRAVRRAPTRSTSRSKAMNDAGHDGRLRGRQQRQRRARAAQGRSDCSTRPSDDGGRESTDGACMINTYSVAPWALSVANGRKDEPGGPGAQHLNFTLVARRPEPAAVDRRPDDRVRADADRARHEHPRARGSAGDDDADRVRAGRPRRRRASRRQAPSSTSRSTCRCPARAWRRPTSRAP